MENKRDIPEERLLLKNLHKMYKKSGLPNAGIKRSYTRLLTKYTKLNMNKIRSARNKPIVFSKREGEKLVYTRPLSKRKTRKNKRV